MEKIIPHTDLTDPQPVYADVSDMELQNRYKWFSYMCQPICIWIFEFIAPLARIFPEWTYKRIAIKTIYKFFVGGETLEECLPVIDRLDSKCVGSIPDLSVETATSKKKIELVLLAILETIHIAGRNCKKIPFTVFKLTGLINKKVLTTISQKLNAKLKLSGKEQSTFDELLAMADKLCATAFKEGVRIMIDAEESKIQDAIDYVALEMMKRYNRTCVTVLNTYQMYRRDGYDHLLNHFEKADSFGYKLGVKIVRGAYMEKERKYAYQVGIASWVFDSKEDTDKAYNKGLGFCIDHIDSIVLMAVTHNKESILLLIRLMKEKGLSPDCDHIYFSQLFGMGDILSFNLARQGYNNCKYLPFGPVRDLVPYLVRRARENSSLHGFASQELHAIKAEMSRRAINN